MPTTVGITVVTKLHQNLVASRSHLWCLWVCAFYLAYKTRATLVFHLTCGNKKVLYSTSVLLTPGSLNTLPGLIH